MPDTYSRLMLAAAAKEEERKRKGLERVRLGDVQIPEPSAPHSAPAAPIVPAVPAVPTAPTVPALPAAPVAPRDSRSQRSRERLNKRQLNVSISAEIVDSLTTFAYHNRRGMADVVEQAVWEYLDANWGVPTAPRDAINATVPAVPSAPASLPSLSLGAHQKMIFDDDDDGWPLMVRIYERATGNPFREGDRAFLAEVQQYGPKCVALGVLLGRSRYGKRISSLRYFGGAILEVAAWPPDKIDKELRFHWGMFLERIGGRL